MDKFKAAIILFFISPSVFAANLCDYSCELLITFPDGGRIEAVEPLTFTFGKSANLSLGETGTVDTAIQPDNLNFSNSGSLSLSAGESISFSKNAEINLGTGGNLDYSNIQINSTGTMQVTAIGGQEEVHLFSIRGTSLASITISAAYVYSYDALDFGTADLTIITSNYIITQPAIEEAVNWEIYTEETVQLSQPSGSLASGSIISGGSPIAPLEGGISLNNSLAPTDDVIILADAPNNNISNDTSVEITLEDSISPPTTVTINNQSCSISSINEPVQCETEDSTIYQFIDGEWIELESTGMLSALNLVLMCLTLCLRRKTFKKVTPVK